MIILQVDLPQCVVRAARALQVLLVIQRPGSVHVSIIYSRSQYPEKPMHTSSIPDGLDFRNAQAEPTLNLHSMKRLYVNQG